MARKSSKYDSKDQNHELKSNAEPTCSEKYDPNILKCFRYDEL
jgi:hypothetical protein